jgi:hypothetical protein
MKICIIGNSHLAALGNAWRLQLKDAYPDLSVTFFGSAQDSLKHLVVDGNRLVPLIPLVGKNFLITTDGRFSIIDFSEFDQVVFVALGFNIFSIRRLLESFSVVEDGDKRVISTQCFVASIAGFIRESLLFDLLRKSVSITSLPMHVVLQPFPAKSVLKNRMADVLRNMVKPELIVNLYKDALSIACKEIGVVPVFQPKETITDNFFTKEIFSKGSVTLLGKKSHDKNDWAHMNTDYGIVVLEGLLGDLSVYPVH